MPRRLVLCFDGTWNKPDEADDLVPVVETNVVKFFRAVHDGHQTDGSIQYPWYDEGVGTDWYDRYRGGIFGYGLDQKICDGYRWLAQNYPDPDSGDTDIFVFGFSRGAYTARSLVGMIRNIGLLQPAEIDRVDDAYAIYRNRLNTADEPAAIDFRSRYSQAIRIKCLGVWDTVGALGLPLQALQWLNSIAYAFHDTTLSKIVDNAFHAVAIDEHRIDFQATLWTDPPDPGQTVEQMWFIGAHGDVGGGDDASDLSNIALYWMMRKAASLGLILDPAQIPTITAANAQGSIFDSYISFLKGAYALTHEPYYRPMHSTLMEFRHGSITNRQGYDPENAGFADVSFPPP